MRDVWGDAEPPMANGEVIFEAPWQGRIFGMATALSEAGVFDWDDFRSQLIAALGASESEDFQYFDCFLEALESVLVAQNLVAPGELAGRVAQYQARPHDHDHT